MRRGKGNVTTPGSATIATYHSGGLSDPGSPATMATLDVRDRTAEFRQCFEGAQQRQNVPAKPSVAKARSEFMSDASAIGKEIRSTSDKLQRLAKLAQRRSLFDDPAEEINEMTAIIKQSISHLSAEVNDLKARSAGTAAANKQAKQHSTSVINSLHTTLKKTTSEFMNVVKARRQNVADQEQRKSQYGASTVPLQSNIFAPGSSLTAASTPSTQPASRQGAPYSSGGLGDAFEQQQLTTLNPQSNYLQDRANDVEAVETTIRELGNIFGELASIVSEQGEMVQRIDSNVDDIEANVSGAQNELFKYLNSISSNRMLVAKVFATLMMFAAIWVVFFV